MPIILPPFPSDKMCGLSGGFFRSAARGSGFTENSPDFYGFVVEGKTAARYNTDGSPEGTEMTEGSMTDMNHTQTDLKTPARKGRYLAWGAILTALVCGGGLWVRFGEGEIAGSIVCTLLAAAVLTLSLVLALAAGPRRR